MHLAAPSHSAPRRRHRARSPRTLRRVACRPQTAPAHTSSLQKVSTTDWDAVLGRDDPEIDAVHNRAYRMQPGAAAWRVGPQAGPVHPMSAADLRAVWRTTRAAHAARIPRRMEAAEPAAIETCRGPPRRCASARSESRLLYRACGLARACLHGCSGFRFGLPERISRAVLRCCHVRPIQTSRLHRTQLPKHQVQCQFDCT